MVVFIYLPEETLKGKPLISLLDVDNLNQQLDNQPDGVFDFIEGITAKSSNGRVIFPIREPFGSHLKEKLENLGLSNEVDKYIDIISKSLQKHK